MRLSNVGDVDSGNLDRSCKSSLCWRNVDLDECNDVDSCDFDVSMISR